MTPTYVINRSNETDAYSVWKVDVSSKTLLTPVHEGASPCFPRRTQLTTAGGYLLACSPLDEDLQQFRFGLFVFDPANTDPLNAERVQAGQWPKDKFWGGYKYRNHPERQQVTDLQLIGVTGYVLSFLPTEGRGSFALWNFDANAADPRGSQDPLPSSMADPDAFPSIGEGHTLLPVGNYVIDWVPADGAYSVYSFDPQRSNPLSQPVISAGRVPSTKGQTALVVVGDCILAWNPETRAYTLYAFKPDNPFDAVMKKGTLPKAFTPETTILSVQPRVSVDARNDDEPGTMDFMRNKIKHVVVYVLESRSFDNVVGWLYDKKKEDGINWVNAKPPFEGASESNANPCGDDSYHQHKYKHGELSVEWKLDEPKNDPFHGTADSIHQQWSGGYPDYQQGKPADMQGFVVNNGSKSVMGSYTPKQLPVLNGLARSFAVSDAWFCSEAGGTTTNRATMATGSAFNVTVSYESGPAYTYFPDTPHRQSLWKVLANNGITDWKIYYSVKWGTPPYPYTYHLYLRGQVPSVDSVWASYVQPIHSFKKAAEKGELPAFSFLEPVWYSPSGMFTSYHPTGDVIPGEEALNEIYNAIKEGPGWDETLFLITFSKGGGLYDHVPSARLKKAWPHDRNDGYAFDTAGARVPAIVVSPWVKEKTVFRSDSDTPFDHTSIAATVLEWFGVPKARWGMGDRVPLAPTFETALQEKKPRRDLPTFGRSHDETYPPKVKIHTSPSIDATWRPAKDTGHWTHAHNWHHDQVPTGKAKFGDSSVTTIRFKEGSQSTVEKIEFEADAPAYTFELTQYEPEEPTLTITRGVHNQSGNVQTFLVTATSLESWRAQLAFMNYASAGGDNVHYSAAPRTPTDRSGGIISFNQQSTAGSATFTVSTGSKTTHDSTVGAEIRFNHNASAHEGNFTAYGTTGSDGDTFGNVVFANAATAHKAHFTNKGGTVSKGDGGNTQFFNTSTAHKGTFVNEGGTVDKANGGDVAFDGTATADEATITNEAAPAEGAYGGVTSFNNNWPPMALHAGASAGHATIHNQGADASQHGSGGHTKFTGMYGAGTADHATIHNYGTTEPRETGAGNTVFSMSGKAQSPWLPTADHATIFNHPGACKGAQAGYTSFAAYDFDDAPVPSGPTAGHATITNQGGTTEGADGGKTKFGNRSTAGHATLIAEGGSNGGWGGTIAFYDTATADKAIIRLTGGELDVSDYGADQLSIGKLEIDGGSVRVQVGDDTTTLAITDALKLTSKGARFSFAKGETGFEEGKKYDLLKAAGLGSYPIDQFSGWGVDGYEAKFELEGDVLKVCFHKSDR